MYKILVSITLGALLWLTAGIAFAQKQTPPAGGQPKDFKLPAKQEYTLDNGLTAVLVPYGDIPKVVVSMVVQVGNVHENEKQNGLADIVGNMMQEGTATRNARQLAEEAARLGGSISVSVGSNETWISGSALSEYGPQLLEMMADLVQNPAFPEAEMSRIKNDFKRQINLQRQQPGAIAQSRFQGALYPNHPYGRDFPTDATIDGFTREQVTAFYEQQFGAGRTTLYVAGKFDEGAMNEAIKSQLSDWRKGPAPQIAVAKPVTKSDMIVVDRPGAPQSTIVFGLPVVDPSHPDYMALRVTNSLLGGSFGSRITRNIREDKGYTYSPYSTLSARYRVGDWAQVADVTTEHTGNSLREIMNEINRMATEAPDEEELDGIKNYEAGLFVLRNSSPWGIVSQLNFLKLHGLPDSFLENQVQNIHAITPQQVQQMTQRYVRPKNMTLVVVGDKKVIDPQLKQFQGELKKNAL